MILVNGDSFTFGDGLATNEKPWPDLIFFNQCVNIAESGSSNSNIFRRTLEEIYLNQYTTVIVAWSGLYRFEWADNYGKAKTFLLTGSRNTSSSIIIKELVTNWHSEFWYFKQFLLTVSNLKLHCDHLGIRFCCLNSSQDVANCYSTTYSNYLDFWKTINLELYPDKEIKREFDFLSKLMQETADCWIIPSTMSMVDFYGENIISTVDKHPNQLGHQLIANKLASVVKSILG